MIRTFLDGIEIATKDGGVAALNAETLASIVAIASSDEAPAWVDAIIDRVRERVELFVDAGGTADSCDWGALSIVERGLLAEAVQRAENRKQGALAFRICRGLTAGAHEALADDDEAQARVKTKARVMAQAVGGV